MFYDTVAAVVTSSRDGGVSIIRVSGPEAISQVSRIFFKCKNDSGVNRIGSGYIPFDLESRKTHTVHYGFVCDGSEGRLEVIDECLVIIMRAPRSYTAEDVAEIQCHGGHFICRLILELLVKNGVRTAEPGEFTKRAFLNGRIDLSQAESVMDVIQSESRLALNNSVSQLRGRVKEKITSLREMLLSDIAFLEAALDDPEHISLEGFPDSLSEHIGFLSDEINSLLRNSENGRLIREGVRAVIVGRPNVGKSSFMNTVLREDRAIVSDIPGTTRDTLWETVRIGSVVVNLVDTAGIRDTDDAIEHIGVERARKSMAEAELVICILNSADEFTIEDIQILHDCEDKKGIVLLNKSDLTAKTDIEAIQKYTDKPILPFSSVSGEGLDALVEKLCGLIFEKEIDVDNEIYITNVRQKQAVLDARESLSRVCESIQLGMPEDLYSIDLMGAYEALGKVIGETVEDDLADKIFSDFCMGK